jgi:hypothetical protein
MSQGLSGSETSLVSAYSFNNSINDLNANANNLTAQGSALATNADSPFTLDANGVPSGTTDYAIVTKVVTSTATVQVPEGCTIPTSGGVSAVAYSTQKAPYGMPTDESKWAVTYLMLNASTQSTPVGGTWYNPSNQAILAPIGKWKCYHDGGIDFGRTTAGNGDFFTLLASTAASVTGAIPESKTGSYAEFAGASGGQRINPFYKSFNLDLTVATTYYRNIMTSLAGMNAIGVRGDYIGNASIVLIPGNL